MEKQADSELKDQFGVPVAARSFLSVGVQEIAVLHFLIT
jgi:hypothetical protein